MVAHREAWVAHRILHRDISVNNILIYYLDSGNAVGLLSDWDLARTEDQLRQGSVLPWRSVSNYFGSRLTSFIS